MLTILNDLHIGAIRTGGTTPRSAYALRGYLLEQFETLLGKTNSDLMILGDLFDTGSVPLPDLLATYRALDKWLALGHKLYLVAGNHDLSRNSAAMSSFQFLSQLLQGRAVSILEPTLTPYGYVIPHVANQDLFNSALEGMPEADVLFVHCNYNNDFAQESDHSLNMSRDQARAAPVKHIVFGHEHNTRTKLAGKVVIPGNQVSSSVSDCLAGEVKQLTTVAGSTVTLIPVEHQPKYEEVDWRTPQSEAQFIRVTGTATAEEAPDAVSKVSRLRQSSEAFVVTNAIEVLGDALDEKFAASLAEVQAFDVLQALKDLLTADEVKILESLK